jgi:hypothetical protein
MAKKKVKKAKKAKKAEVKVYRLVGKEFGPGNELYRYRTLPAYYVAGVPELPEGKAESWLKCVCEREVRLTVGNFEVPAHLPVEARVRVGRNVMALEEDKPEWWGNTAKSCIIEWLGNELRRRKQELRVEKGRERKNEAGIRMTEKKIQELRELLKDYTG